MNTRDKISIAILVGALGVAAVLGLRSNHDEPSITRTTESDPPQGNPPQGNAPPMMDDPQSGGIDPQGPLPPGHPQVGQGGAMMNMSPHPAGGETSTGSLTWTAPPAFVVQPNPSNMRLATYRIAKTGADKDDAELSVTLAGGDPNANIARWAGQFEGGTTPQKKEKTVDGRKVIIVEMSGTYGGGMGTMAGSHVGWTMLAAIVDAGDGQSYFFKMTGPTATVQAAKAPFDTLIGSIKPSA
jgi:hypothetical protein